MQFAVQNASATTCKNSRSFLFGGEVKHEGKRGEGGRVLTLTLCTCAPRNALWGRGDPFSDLGDKSCVFIVSLIS